MWWRIGSRHLFLNSRPSLYNIHHKQQGTTNATIQNQLGGSLTWRAWIKSRSRVTCALKYHVITCSHTSPMNWKASNISSLTLWDSHHSPLHAITLRGIGGKLRADGRRYLLGWVEAAGKDPPMGINHYDARAKAREMVLSGSPSVDKALVSVSE